jgi:hypothetical protein
MADEVNAAVQRMQPLLRQTVLNGLATQTCGKQLAARDDAVLRGGDVGNRRVACHERGQTAGKSVRPGRGRSSAPSAGPMSGTPRSRAAILQLGPLAGSDTPLPCRFSDPRWGGRAQLSHTRALNDSER